MSTTVHRLRFDLDDQAADRYPEVPFTLDGADSVEVTLRYDTSAAVVDLGCLDPERWRGWSGGARDRFVIRRDRATRATSRARCPTGGGPSCSGSTPCPPRASPSS